MIFNGIARRKRNLGIVEIGMGANNTSDGVGAGGTGWNRIAVRTMKSSERGSRLTADGRDRGNIRIGIAYYAGKGSTSVVRQEMRNPVHEIEVTEWMREDGKLRSNMEEHIHKALKLVEELKYRVK
eukprot:TRINITY_DN2880_c1_g1::TRINITY_DN2880_c1_g1_i1::g.6005::m.6005 TRINITY_DN2880_c1_g1::TRINITY_DN2880_c1_g1_i1::g.6005  ORF type:complete len:126 (+),score=-12.05,UPF0254/PF06787.6/3.9e+02,UPF0254/PF06787.6/0.41 TRINITY_DN2880_c1_g1_i1:2203-2580(+)